jgi:hypothetical protein
MSPRSLVVVELSQSELAVRIGEAFLNEVRPADATPEEILAMLGAEESERLLAAAKVAMEYFSQQLGKAQPQRTVDHRRFSE